MNTMPNRLRSALAGALLIAPSLPLPAQSPAVPAAPPTMPAMPVITPPSAGQPLPLPPLPVVPTNALATNGMIASVTTNADGGIQLNFRDAPLDQVLNMYGELTGRTIIRAPQITAIITLRSQSSLTSDEAIQALESALALNNITLVPMGPKFSKVTKSEIGRQEGLTLQRGGAGGKPAAETDQMVSYIVTLKYIDTEEAAPVLQNIIHTYGKIQPMERANSFMITDTSANIQRIQEILEFMDQPPTMRVETRFFKLEHGNATDIATQLNALVEDTQAKTTRPSTSIPGMPIPMPMPTSSARPPSVSTTAGETMLTEGGLIQGRVKILADDRTNMLIIIARPANFTFFEQIITALDRKVDPEVVVHVVQLHWTTADNITPLLGDVLGSSGGVYGMLGQTSGGTTGSSTLGSSSAGGTSGGSMLGRSTSTSSSSLSRNRTTSSTAPTSASRPTGATGTTGAASPNPFGNNAPNVSTITRVIGDRRSNSLIIMGTKEDIAVLEKMIEQLDVMLSQVLLEVVILEVDINKTTESGINWLQRSMQAYNQTAAGPGGGLQINQPVAAFGGGWNSATASATIPNGASVLNGFAMPPGLNYYTTISGLNLDTVIHLVNRATDARVLSTPVVMATDNQTAAIKNTTERPVITSSTILATGTASSQSTYEYKDIGIELDVTPHINPNRVVVLDISVTSDTIASEVVIDGNQVPVISARDIQGTISVEDRTSIVLGGLAVSSSNKSRDTIPILGSIPLIGWLFRNDNNSNERTELLVLITPYVCKTPEEARAETKRFHENSEMKEELTRGWSASPLAKPDPEIERAKRKRTLFGNPPTPTNAVSTNAVSPSDRAVIMTPINLTPVTTK